MSKPKWEDRHTRMAKEFEAYLPIDKPKLNASYSKYIKSLHVTPS